MQHQQTMIYENGLLMWFPISVIFQFAGGGGGGGRCVYRAGVGGGVCVYKCVCVCVCV